MNHYLQLTLVWQQCLSVFHSDLTTSYRSLQSPSLIYPYSDWEATLFSHKLFSINPINISVNRVGWHKTGKQNPAFDSGLPRPKTCVQSCRTRWILSRDCPGPKLKLLVYFCHIILHFTRGNRYYYCSRSLTESKKIIYYYFHFIQKTWFFLL